MTIDEMETIPALQGLGMMARLRERLGHEAVDIYLAASMHDCQSPLEVSDLMKGAGKDVSLTFIREVFAACYDIGLAVDESQEVH